MTDTPAGPGRSGTLVRTALVVLVVVLAGLAALAGAPGPPAPTYARYVALGDSFTAAPFVPVSDIAYGCYRSTNNYPHLVARELRIDDLRDRSCSGAQTADLTGSQRTARGMAVRPQLEALTPETDLVTMGIGANNYRLYARLATVCRKLTTICPLDDQRALFGAILDRLRPALVASIEQVRERAPRARVLLVSYPQLLPDRGDCAKLPRMRPQDRETFRDVNRRLVEEMAAAADEAGVEFVDYYTASHGHDICSARPWVQGRVGNARQAAALHPLPAGQEAVAQLVAARLRTPLER
ncbi:GDSL-like Lipase/Acylhydrolase family protein [Nocardioides scoriae]|uniref:GDSL-like Lipase/Acylhydrolase family protein n=1 Tax=Nocardioides scoriae TaxID=642780 RepID=A0A1H1X6V6_9ACTN|nr:SGNH/GDSL hydrolase family protein [Nocardioides scoriae]SDT05095.1 GDSL-like Lipase/Acylhydrolase family protein [Nocardioides scoriae]